MNVTLDGSPASEVPSLRSRGGQSTGHDAACDQCRSKKIRCNRQHPVCLPCARRKSKCSWGNKGRKTNQVADGLQGIDNRLNTIETSLQSIMQFMQSSGGAPSRLSSQLPDTTLSSILISSIPTVTSAPATKSPVAKAHRSLVLRAPRHGSFYGGSSLQASLNGMNELIESRLSHELPHEMSDPCESIWGRFLDQRETAFHELSDALESETQPYIDADHTLKLPPQRVLEAVIEPYFMHIESEIPLLERTRCIAAIDECYSGHIDDVDPAWKVIFNYIMIQCFLGRYMPLERPSKDIDFLLTKEFELPFLASLWAALSQLSLFMQPSFANIQALVALTVISQRYFSVTAAKMSLHIACFVAKAMGLHRNDVHAHLTHSEIEERRRVFWALFTIDKELSFVLGLTPCLPSYDCDMPLPDAVSQFSLFRARFSQLTESIYVTLYSSLAAKKDQSQIERDITQLEADLLCLSECDALTQPSENIALQLESQYLYGLGSIMVLHCSKDEDRLQRCVQEARNCISYLSRIRDSDTTIGGFMVLRRPFQWRPSMPFFVVISSIYTDADLSKQHEHLLSAKAFVDTLRSVAWTDDASSYCGTLLQVAETCLELSRTFVQICETSGPNNSEDEMSVEEGGSSLSSAADE